MASAAGDDRAAGATVRQVLELTAAARLLPADDLAALRARWPESKLGDDGGELARSLVRSGKLTKHQAAALYQNQAKALSVGEYVLLERIGSGGIGTVYKARKHDGLELVAVKVLN